MYDLRGEEEQEKYPERLPEIVSVKVVSLPIFYPGLDPWVTARRIVINGDVEEGEFHQVMIEAYRAYVLDFRPQWSMLLKGLAEPGTLPALIHCTYGKDRTGVAVAIVLRSLGVPREKIMEDYLLSNKFWGSKTELYSCLANCASCFRTPRSEVRALMEVRPEYLQASFAAIDERYGSFDNYLHQGLSIDEQTLESLRAALLQQESLTLSPSSNEFLQNPKLLERILEGPHNYFRFIDIQFAEAVCLRFQEQLGAIPDVNLHGDAHLENYAVTERGRGLTDFDDATIGPMVLDLVRFGVSIHLACRANGWEDKAESIVKSFLSNYGAALENPELTIPPPELVRRIRAGFTTDTDRLLRADEEVMQPLREPLENFKAQFEQFVDQMKVRYPDLSPYFFEIKKAGQLNIGIGSALDEKYLVEVEGATKAHEDDLLLEIKEVTDLRGISCILLGKPTPMRPIVIQALLAYEPYRYTGFIIVPQAEGSGKEKAFWVHEWYDNYHELSIRTSFQSPADLRDIATDVGVQLGLGHPRNLYDSDTSGLRSRLVSVLAGLHDEIEQTISDLTRQTVAAWEQFRAEASKHQTSDHIFSE